MGNKHKVVGLKAKLWGSVDEAPSRRKQSGVWGQSPQCLAIFVVF